MAAPKAAAERVLEVMMEKFQTKHPAGKSGVRIDAAKYGAMKEALLAVISPTEPGTPFSILKREVEAHLPEGVFAAEDSRGWYVTVVKQDLEARGLIEQLPGSRPQRLRRI